VAQEVEHCVGSSEFKLQYSQERRKRRRMGRGKGEREREGEEKKKMITGNN
jgi:hypothetical protein